MLNFIERFDESMMLLWKERKKKKKDRKQLVVLGHQVNIGMIKSGMAYMQAGVQTHNNV